MRAGRVVRALGVAVLGPAPQAMARLRRRYRWHLLLKATHAGRLREAERRRPNGCSPNLAPPES